MRGEVLLQKEHFEAMNRVIERRAAEARAAKGVSVITTPENRWGRCDIKTVGLRELFGGVFKAAQPLVQKFVDTFSSPAFMGALRGLDWSEGRRRAAAFARSAPAVLAGAMTGDASLARAVCPTVSRLTPR